VWTLGFEARVTGQGRIKARVQFLDASNAVLATHDTAAWQTPAILPSTPGANVTVTTPGAPASTAKVRATILCSNTGAGTGTYTVRRAQLEKSASASTFRVGPQTVSNNPSTGRALPIWVPGDAPVPAILDIKGDTGAEITSAIVARRWSGGRVGGGALADYLNETKYANLEASGHGWTVTLGTDTASAAEATATGGNLARTSFAGGDKPFKRRVKLTRTTKLDSLVGEWDVLIRHRPQQNAEIQLQLREGASSAEPAPNAHPVVVFDTYEDGGTTTISAFTEQWLARVTFPDEDLEGILLELWTQAIARLQGHEPDCLFFVPADEAALLTLPPGGADSTLGAYLTTPISSPASETAGAVDGDSLKLAGATQSGGVGPNAGTDYGATRQVFEFHLYTEGTIDAQCVVRNVTDGNDAAGRSINDTAPGEYVRTVTVDTVSGKLYQAQVRSNQAGTFWVKEVIRRPLDPIGASEHIYTRPDEERAVKQDSAGKFAQELEPDGSVPIWLGPGLNLVVLVVGEKPPALSDPGVVTYRDQTKLTRAPVVTVSVAPHYHL
jgi:hypothetical protein